MRNARSRFLRGAMALSGLTAMASGAYLYIQGQELWIKAKQAGLSRLEDSETAPAETEVAANSPAPPKTDAQRTTSAGNDHPLQVHANHKTAPETERAGSDRPIFETSGNDLTVKLGVKIPADPHERLLRSGPGSEFAPLGAPEKGVAYTVTGWTDHWYRVLLPETSAQPAGPSGGATRSEASPPGTIEIRTSQGKTTEIQSSATGIAGASGNLGARALAEANSAAVAPTQLPSVGEIQQSARDTALKRRQRTAWIRSDLVQVLPVGLPASGQTR